MLTKVLSAVFILISPVFVNAEEPDIKCFTYADSQSGVEISVTNYVGTLTGVLFDGTRAPHALGDSYLVEDIVTKLSEYHFIGGEGELKGVVLNYWPEQPLTVETAMSADIIQGFKGEIVYINGVKSAAVCNWQ